MSTKITRDGWSILSNPKNFENAKKYIEERISIHRKKIEEHRQLIIDHIDFPNIVNELNEKINFRLAKIEEAEQILEYCF